MQKKFFLLAVLFVILVFNPAFSADKNSFQIKKQPEIQQVKPKKPVKIKLNALRKGNIHGSFQEMIPMKLCERTED